MSVSIYQISRISKISKISKKLLYIGSWSHFKVTTDFNKTPEFVFIDTQPRSEFDFEIFDPVMYRTRFYDQIIEKSKKYGFELKSTTVLDPSYASKIKADPNIPFVCPTLLTFEKENEKDKKEKQTIKYYISTNIMYNMTSELEAEINSCDGLILSGYFPHKLLLKMLSSDTIYCYTDTCYNFDIDDIDDIDNILSALQSLDKNYLVICKKTGKTLFNCKTIDQVNNFCKKYRSINEMV
jgi:hypothetical protein